MALRVARYTAVPALVQPQRMAMINLLRQLFSPPIRPVFAPADGAPTLIDSRLLVAQPTIRKILRTMVLMWVWYFLLLALVDQWSMRVRPDIQPLPVLYYIGHIFIALLILLLSRWQVLQQRVGRAFLPLLIALMSLGPIMIMVLLIPATTPGPIVSAPGLFGLRALPMLCAGMVLTACTYSWRYVVGYVVGTSALMIIFSLPAQNVGTISAVTIMQTINLLIFGYCISALTSFTRVQHDDLLHANMRLRHYASTLERLTVSRERNRMARELHDTLAHTLSGLTVQLETIKAYLDVDAATAAKLVNNALSTARVGLQETRRALKDLRVSPLDDLGLRLALQVLAESSAAAVNVSARIDLPADMPQLPADVEQALYRIAQEAITNAVVHAQPDALELRLRVDERCAVLTVGDDGCGFELDQPARPGHFGLPGMRERAELLGGQCTIASAPGCGTTVCATLPL